MTDNKKELTSNTFKLNTFTQKHNIELSKLNYEHDKTNETLLNGIFALIYSSFENYLTDIYTVAKKINNSLPELNDKSLKNNDTLLSKIAYGLSINIEKEYEHTLDYIRLKRNRLIHPSSTNISRSLREIINKDGVKLNAFWNDILPKKLQEIDFCNNDNANKISYNILIDILNIFRKISNNFDIIILKKIDTLEFLKKEVFVEFKDINKYKNFSLTDERNKRKFIGFCKAEYGFEPTEYDIQKMV